jgi:hypothetical protein
VLKELWAKVANECLQRTGDEGRAIREANAVIRVAGERHYQLPRRSPARARPCVCAPAAATTGPTGILRSRQRPLSCVPSGSTCTAVVTGADGVAVFDALHHRRRKAANTILYAFDDLLELNGEHPPAAAGRP